ncbi:MAG: phosphate ABC transporter permease subunit PstC [Nitrospinales bacterium]
MSRFLKLDLPRYVVATSAFFSLLCVGTLFFYLVHESLPLWQAEGWAFLTGRDWLVGEVYGALPMVYGSVMVTGLALILVLPFALGSAIFTSEYLPSRMRLLVKSIMELLAGVPGIVYGLLGVSLLTVWLKDVFGLIDGNSILAAALLLAVMILPTVMTLSEDALRAVPAEYRETAWSLGLTKMETIGCAVLPQALPGIAGAVFLGLGRALGETIAVMLVIGSLDRVPQPWYDLFAPAQSIPSKLGREAAEALGSGQHWNALIGLGLVLFILVMVITLIGNLSLRRVRL